jgi:hypothetical protein
MKKTFFLAALLLCSLALSMSVKADVVFNSTNFPDSAFRKYLVELTGVPVNGTFTDAKIATITSIDCTSKSIANLKGVEYFTALTQLRCYGNNLTALDVSKNTALTELSCSANELTTLDLSKNTVLTNLACHNNQLTALDVSKNTALTELMCCHNQLTALDLSKNTALTYLDCGCNPLYALDVSKNTALTYLDCNNNILTSLDVSKNTALTYLDCRSNHLYALDVSKNTALTTLKCYDNQLAALDVSKNTALTGLDCNDNQLTALDVSKNTALTGLHCFNNRLAALDLSKNPMITSFQGYKNSRTIKVYSYTRSAVHGGGTGYYVPLTAQAAITLKDGTHYGATKALATLIYDAGQMGDPAFDITKVVSGTWGGATLGTFNGTQVLLLDANAKAITYQYNTGFTGTCTYWYAYSSGDKTTVTAPNAYFTLNWVATHYWQRSRCCYRR